MLDAEGNVSEVNGRPVCLMCHSSQPDPVMDWTADVSFRADIAFLCWRCHPQMPASFYQRRSPAKLSIIIYCKDCPYCTDGYFHKHFLAIPSAKVLDKIKEIEEKLIVTIPLVPRGRITCSTCHNPHQYGVLQHEGAAKGADAIRRLRLPSICFACHGM